MSQYDQCSKNTACGCFHIASVNDTGICGFRWVTCTELIQCQSSSNTCSDPDHICVYHPQCYDHPVCYPISMIDQELCPPIGCKKTKSYLNFHVYAEFE